MALLIRLALPITVKAMRIRSDISKQSSGFTIVEVMIVLAIAGIILLLVFEAIPTLTRNSRNNQRSQDATAILQVISQYELNNSGNFPEGCGQGFSTNCKTINSSSLLYYTTLTYYEPTTTQVTVHPQTETDAAPLAAATNTNAVNVYDFEKCTDGVQDTASNVGADYNDVVAMYALESGGTPDSQCQQL
jgi:prepilin-type N-terminal cleavage/methylation domain-containing protein